MSTLKQTALRRNYLGDPLLVMTEYPDGRRTLEDISASTSLELHPDQDAEVEADLWDFAQGNWELTQQHEVWSVRIQMRQVPLLTIKSDSGELLITRDWANARWPSDEAVSQIVSRTLNQKIVLRKEEPTAIDAPRDSRLYREVPCVVS